MNTLEHQNKIPRGKSLLGQWLQEFLDLLGSADGEPEAALVPLQVVDDLQEQLLALLVDVDGLQRRVHGFQARLTEALRVHQAAHGEQGAQGKAQSVVVAEGFSGLHGRIDAGQLSVGGEHANLQKSPARPGVHIKLEGYKGSGKTLLLHEIGAALNERGFNVECIDDFGPIRPRRRQWDRSHDQRLIRITTHEAGA